MKSSQFSGSAAELDARVARFGQQVAAGLTERSAALPHDVSERLRFARERALAHAVQARAAATAAEQTTSMVSAGMVRVGSTLAMTGSPLAGMGGNKRGGWWSMLVSALPLLLLAAGLLLMQLGQENQQIAAAAEVDTALLSDSLPPAAFTDPGFSEFLRDAEE